VVEAAQSDLQRPYAASNTNKTKAHWTNKYVNLWMWCAANVTKYRVPEIYFGLSLRCYLSLLATTPSVGYLHRHKLACAVLLLRTQRSRVQSTGPKWRRPKLTPSGRWLGVGCGCPGPADWPDVNMIKSPNERRADSDIIR